MGFNLGKALGGGIASSLINPVLGPAGALLGGTGKLGGMFGGGRPGDGGPVMFPEIFNRYAAEEEARRRKFGLTSSKQILSARNALIPSLQQQAKSQFEMINPSLLEDLNSRGLLSSPSEVARSQAQALKEIQLGNQGIYNDYTSGALSAKLQGGQDALDSALGLRTAGLQSFMQGQQANAERSFAENLAAKQRKNDLWGSLIGAGGSILGAFCFDEMTPITMKDGSQKPICEIDLDEETKGGTVLSVRIAKTPDGTLYNYKGEIVTGSHAVKEEGGWIRVQDSIYSEPIDGERVVYCLVTSNHRIFVNGIEFADEVETDAGCNNSDPMSLKESLFELNRQDNFAGVNGHGS